MAQLFAAYLTQKTDPKPVSGEYDPEQELWVGDNQLQGATRTLFNTGTITGPDTSFDSDNP